MKPPRDIVSLYSGPLPPVRHAIQCLLEERNLTQRQLAKRLGVPSSYLSTALRGRKGNIGEPLLARLASALVLTDSETSSLREAADLSRVLYRLPVGQPGWHYALASKFHQRIESLPPEIARVIDCALNQAPSLTMATSKEGAASTDQTMLT